MSSGEWKLHYRRMTRVSLLVLFLETPVILALNVLRDPAAESVDSMVVPLVVLLPFDVILGVSRGRC